MALARPFLDDPLAVPRWNWGRCMERFIKDLFIFLSDPACPQTTTPPSGAYGIW